ncbi:MULTISPECIES: DUF5325 family protein [Kyrpidia]|uniref:Uncharacterized protein n=1 Tax=Kyrpidia spormannii TaxID=2055160 RepID=A0ACA8ZCM8_9BACL|nr:MULTISPECIES: DUF5325 family protein [Kyrpidia]MCL6575814.1 DUF5325 family protein [Kyrpidia sp.]CAB3394381.1 conserved protein of unknown function [Kyrpidia spormannii]HHY67753.1 DUF5325 family protein [Alicyclobacillus sp.]
MTQPSNHSSDGVPRKYRPIFFVMALVAIFCFALVGQSLSDGNVPRAVAALIAAVVIVGAGFIWRGRLLR